MKYIVRVALVIALVLIGISLSGEIAAEHPTPAAPETARVDVDSQILVWNAPGVEPGRQAADNVGELAYINGEGNLTTLADVLAQSSRVEACGPNALSPDGQHLALYQGVVGGIVSSLYLVTDGNAPQLVNDAFQPLGCVGGNGIINFAPDSSYMSFIEYERNYDVGFADGVLRVVSTSDLTERFSAREVVAFEQAPDGVAFVRFFTNDRNQADEVAIVFWDGNIDRELTSFFAEEGCRYLNASITTAPDGQLWLGLVNRCTSEGVTKLSVYRINPQERSFEFIFEGESGGAYGPTVQSNNIWFTQDGNYVLYTLPDGVTQSTVSLNAYDLNTAESFTLVERGMVVGGVGGQAANNDFSRLSPDGRFLITVVTSIDGRDNEMRLFNLENPSFAGGNEPAPLVIPAGGQGDFFPYIDFTRDGNRMVYVAGGRDNSLFILELNADTINPIRVRRGAFNRYATLSPDGTEIAILENAYPDDEREDRDRFTVLQVINLDTTEVIELFRGAEVVDGDVENREFAAPIFWLK